MNKELKNYIINELDWLYETNKIASKYEDFVLNIQFENRIEEARELLSKLERLK